MDDISQGLQEITTGELPLGKEPKPFKGIAKKEKVCSTKEKLPLKPDTPAAEHRPMFTPAEAAELRQMFTLDEFCELFTGTELRQIFTPDEFCEMFTEIVEVEKIGSTFRGKKFYTREDLCQILTPKQLCQILTPEEPEPFKEIAEKEKVGITVENLPRGEKLYTPEDLCRVLTPKELCLMFKGEELLYMFTLDGLRRILPRDLLSSLRFSMADRSCEGSIQIRIRIRPINLKRQGEEQLQPS